MWKPGNAEVLSYTVADKDAETARKLLLEFINSRLEPFEVINITEVYCDPRWHVTLWYSFLGGPRRASPIPHGRPS